MMRYMSASAWMCYTLICRRTIGWHKCADVISNSQFCADTGLSKATVIRALKELATLGAVEMTPTKIHGQPANQYTMVGLSFDTLGGVEFIPPSIKSIPPSAKLTPPSIKIDAEVVSKLYRK
jgi:DNA-binding transcriptional MocR family regulator